MSKYIIEDEPLIHDKRKEVHNTIMKSKKYYCDSKLKIFHSKIDDIHAKRL